MEQAHRDQPKSWRRWEPLTGVAFIALFLAGFLMMVNGPNPNDSNATWHTYFADRGHQVLITASGFILVAAGLCLLAFLTTAWLRIGARRGAASSPLPLIAAGVAAASIVIGAVSQAVVTGSMLFGSMPEPGADTLRLGLNLSFPFIAVAGMFAASLSIAGLSIQAYSAGIVGRRLLIPGLVVAVGLLASVFFFPMVLLLVWAAVMTAVLMRQGAGAPDSVEVRPSAQLSGTATRAPNGAATPAAR